MAPTERPLPRHVAEPPHELEPYGRWRERLEQRFLAACAELEDFGSLGAPGEIEWYPERTYAGRAYVPATAPTAEGYELFGFVSFERLEAGGDPEELDVQVDFTEETAERNPDWKLDLNEEVIGRWRGPGSVSGELTLVWGTPLVPGSVVATAELGEETLDQCALVQSDRFTLIALDAVRGLGEDLYLEVKLWDRRSVLVAVESLYAEGD
jgi:hypothetical protein